MTASLGCSEICNHQNCFSSWGYEVCRNDVMIRTSKYRDGYSSHWMTKTSRQVKFYDFMLLCFTEYLLVNGLSFNSFMWLTLPVTHFQNESLIEVTHIYMIDLSLHGIQGNQFHHKFSMLGSLGIRKAKIISKVKPKVGADCMNICGNRWNFTDLIRRKYVAQFLQH